MDGTSVGCLAGYHPVRPFNAIFCNKSFGYSQQGVNSIGKGNKFSLPYLSSLSFIFMLVDIDLEAMLLLMLLLHFLCHHLCSCDRFLNMILVSETFLQLRSPSLVYLGLFLVPAPCYIFVSFFTPQCMDMELEPLVLGSYSL